MSTMDDLMYNPVTGMFEQRHSTNTSSHNNTIPNIGNNNEMPNWNPQITRRVDNYTRGSSMPIISTFRRKGRPVFGKYCKFEWSVSNTTHLHVSGLGDVPFTSSGSCMVLLLDDYQEITLTASNATESTSRTLKVYAENPPVIDFFIVDPSVPQPYKVGDRIKINWRCFGTNSVKIDNQEVCMQGQKEIVLREENEIHKLVATTNYSSTPFVKELVLNGLPLAFPVINYFRKQGNDIEIGDECVLEWDVQGAQHVRLEGPRLMHVRHQGTSHVFVEAAPRVYKLTATDALGREISESITIAPATPQIASFIQKESVEPIVDTLPKIMYFQYPDAADRHSGKKVPLHWRVENAERVELLIGKKSFPQETLEGSFDFKIIRDKCTITLVAYNGPYKAEKKLTIEMQKSFFKRIFG